MDESKDFEGWEPVIRDRFGRCEFTGMAAVEREKL